MADLGWLEVAGGGAGGAGVLALVAKIVLGGVFQQLKDQMVELKADMREHVASIKASVEKHGDKQEAISHSLTLVQAQAASAHQRLDVVERDIQAIESRCLEEAKGPK